MPCQDYSLFVRIILQNQKYNNTSTQVLDANEKIWLCTLSCYLYKLRIVAAMWKPCTSKTIAFSPFKKKHLKKVKIAELQALIAAQSAAHHGTVLLDLLFSLLLHDTLEWSRKKVEIWLKYGDTKFLFSSNEMPLKILWFGVPFLLVFTFWEWQILSTPAFICQWKITMFEGCQSA